jgi:methionine synthase I (cobalamin-dependent)
LADGAWATELHRLGLVLSECPDEWNLSHPERVEAVARSYVDAGSQIILTNTFRANRVSLPSGRVQEVNAAGVEISKRAAAEAVKVVASIGPCGNASALKEQAQVLATAGADALLLETFTDLRESTITASAVKRTGLPVIVSFTFTGDITPEEAVKRMVEAGVDAVGANCGVGIEGFPDICARMRGACDLPLWMKPSAGLPGKTVTAERFAATAVELLAAGADIVGGCCGTTPEFIERMRWPVLNYKHLYMKTD